MSAFRSREPVSCRNGFLQKKYRFLGGSSHSRRAGPLFALTPGYDSDLPTVAEDETTDDPQFVGDYGVGGLAGENEDYPQPIPISNGQVSPY